MMIQAVLSSVTVSHPEGLTLSEVLRQKKE